MHTQTEFSEKAISIIQSIPKGKVATYALIAKLAGNPRAPRMVGWLLHTCTKKHRLPWQRVIKSDGSLPFSEFSANGLRHKQLLEMEGVVATNNHVDLKKYIWQPD